jgi:chloramphenicol-sensitive protein RarD
VNVDSPTGTFLETLFLLPLTLVFLGVQAARGVGAFGTASLPINVFLVLAGVVTGVPLLWFASGARLIPLSLVGFLQYLTPTMNLLFGVIAFNSYVDFAASAAANTPLGRILYPLSISVSECLSRAEETIVRVVSAPVVGVGH